MCAFLLGLAVAPGLAEAADQTLVLALVINGVPSNKIGEFTLRDGRLLARPQELDDLGFKVPAGVAGKDGLVALSALPGVTLRLDKATQTLYVTAPTERLRPVLLSAERRGPGPGQVESGTGVTLNYDVTGSSVFATPSGTQNIATGLFDLRAFSPYGVLSSGTLAYLGAGPNGPGTNSAIRLDSVYVYSDPDSMRRYRLGDFITGGLSWTRPVRLGGAQIATDFSLRPDLVTFPVPALSGSVAVPSTVDVLVNGAHLMSRAVQPGPFQIPQLPVITGASTVSMTVIDALGRQVTTTLPFYASSELLAPGLQAYSLEVGAVRNEWGVVSNDYQDVAGSATYRRGLSPELTIETHAEGVRGVAMAGGGVAVNLFNQGVFNFAAAASGGSAPLDSQFSVGIQRTAQVLSLGASASFAGHNFRDIAAQQGDPVPRRQINASAGLSLGRFGSFGLAYTAVDRDAVPVPVRYYVPGSFITQTSSVPGGVLSVENGMVSFFPSEHSRILTASYSLQLGRVAAYATCVHDFAADASSVIFGLTIPLGSRSSVSAGGSTGTGGSAQLQAQQTPVSIGDWGYQAFVSPGSSVHDFGQLQYKSPWALVSGGVDHDVGQTTLRSEAQGALSFADGGLFASNTINDSFAVVDTNGVKGVHVLSENRDAGTTDSAGKLLVPDLHSYQPNQIAIDPNDVPPDASLPYASRLVRPQDRSGVVVKFPIRKSHGALVAMVDRNGKPVPVGSTATLQSTGAVVSVGYDGLAFIVGLESRNRVTVQFPDGQRCSVTFAYRPIPDDIPRIGPLSCKEENP
jgi:outer membrane usher protein